MRLHLLTGVALLAVGCATTPVPVPTAADPVVTEPAAVAAQEPPPVAPVDAPEVRAPAVPVTSAPTASPTTAPAATSPTEPRPAFPADRSPDTGEPAGFPVTVTDVRTGRQDGFDRLVFEVRGDGRPGWDVRYVGDPRGQATGDAVEVSGGAVLEIVLSHTATPADSGHELFDGPRRRATGGRATTELVFDSLFEGITQFHLGIDRERPFRVFWLDDRVVVDVRIDD